MSCYVMLCVMFWCLKSCYVMLYYLMSVDLLSFRFHFGIDGMSAESRCTWSRSKHPNINAQGCIYKISHQRRQLHRRSTVWTKANGFLSSRPVIPTEPGPGMSIPHKLQHRIETERFAMSFARRFSKVSQPQPLRTSERRRCWSLCWTTASATRASSQVC